MRIRIDIAGLVGVSSGAIRVYSALQVETHDATNRCDTSQRQVAATNRLV